MRTMDDDRPWQGGWCQSHSLPPNSTFGSQHLELMSDAEVRGLVSGSSTSSPSSSALTSFFPLALLPRLFWFCVLCICEAIREWGLHHHHHKFQGWKARVSALALAWLNLNELNCSWLQTLDSKPCTTVTLDLKDPSEEGVTMMKRFATHTHLKVYF